MNAFSARYVNSRTTYVKYLNKNKWNSNSGIAAIIFKTDPRKDLLPINTLPQHEIVALTE